MTTQHSQSTVGSVTVFGRLSHTRGSTAYAILLLLTPLVVGATAWQAVTRMRSPDVGLTSDDSLHVEAVDHRWAGVKKGDRIVALDGVTLVDPADWVRKAQQHDQAALTVTFERDGKSWSSSATATPMRLVDQGAVWARVVTGATLMIMGLVAFVLRPGVSVTWLLLLLAWDLGAFLLLKIGLYRDPHLYRQVATYPWIIATAVGMHFLCFFPQRLAPFAKNPWRAAWFYVPLLAGPIVHATSAEGRMSKFGTLWGVTAALAVTVVIATQYRRVRHSKDAHARSQYRALLVGFGAGLVLPGIWNWLRVSWGIWDGPWAAHYNALPLVMFVGVTSYAVVRHNALEIDRFTAAVVGYATTMLVVAGTFAAALLGIPLLFGTSGLADSPVLLVLVTALTFASFSPVYRRVKRWVDVRFFREQADAAEMADALRELVVTMQRSDRDESVAAALEAVRVLKSDRAEIWLLSEDHKQLSYRYGDGPRTRSEVAVSLDGPLSQALKSGMTAGVEGLSPRIMESAAQEELWSKELAMAAPVMIHAVLAGFVGVGRKRSGAGYQPEELSFLSIVGAQLGPTLERSQTESTQLDRYHLERRLGTGGMAEVFLAWQVGPGGFERKVAVKRPLPHLSEDPNAVASFLDEARLAAQLQHANIAQVYDVGESQGTYFIVMEYIDGPSLRQVLRQLHDDEQRIPLSVAVALILQVHEALAYAHGHKDEQGRALNLVHRDITPRNILLTMRGDVKLVDFGIARAQFQLHVTRTGTIKGTLPYMSPEQATGEDQDHKSDLYSAGALLYELLTGEKAYPRGPFPIEPPPARDLVPELPPTVDPMLCRAMAYHADKRYSSAAQQSQALLDAIAPHEPASRDVVATWLSAVRERMTTDDPTATTIDAATSTETAKLPVDAAEGAETVVQVRRRVQQ